MICRHCGMPIERDTIGWHHTANKRIVCQLVTTAEPPDEVSDLEEKVTA